MTLDSQKQRLLEEMRREFRPDWVIPVHMGLTELVAIVANLQLALRNEGNQGTAREVAREFISAVIARVEQEGFRAHAIAMRLGDDPKYDVPEGRLQ